MSGLKHPPAMTMFLYWTWHIQVLSSWFPETRKSQLRFNRWRIMEWKLHEPCVLDDHAAQRFQISPDFFPLNCTFAVARRPSSDYSSTTTLIPVANQQTAQFNELFCRWKLQKSRVVNSEWFPGEVTWQTQSSSCELSSTLAKNTTSKAVMLTSDLLVFWSMGHISSFKTSASLAPLILFAVDSSSRSSCPLTENAPWSILHIIPSELYSWSLICWILSNVKVQLWVWCAWRFTWHHSTKRSPPIT